MSVAGGQPSAGQPLIGGRYRLGRRLGFGGVGVVHEALDERLGRRVAVKLIRSDRLDADSIARFEREARATAALHHPHIVQVTDYGREEDGSAFLVMELLEGCSLGELIASRGALPADRVVSIARQILSALDVAHAAGLVHRDIKPANAFLVPVAGMREIVKLLDFGIAKLTEGGGEGGTLTQTGAVLGTPAFMAPEQARDEVLSPRTDLYALGATMYNALAGRLPFPARTPHAMIAAILTTAPLPLTEVRPDIDRGLVVVIERAMAKPPEQRYASAAEMRDALAPFDTTTGSVQAQARAAALPSTVVAAAPAAAPPGASRSGITKLIVIAAVVAIVGGIGAGVVLAPALGGSDDATPPPVGPPTKVASLPLLDPRPIEPLPVGSGSGGSSGSGGEMATVGMTETPEVTAPPEEIPAEAPEADTLQPPAKRPPPPERPPEERPPPPERPRELPTEPSDQASVPASGGETEFDRRYARMVANYVHGNCRMPDGREYRSTAVLTISEEGRQVAGHFVPPVPQDLAQCVFMHSMQTNWPRGQRRTVRIPFTVEGG